MFRYGSIVDTQGWTMATLTIKNVPEKLHRRLKERTARHQRSTNNEVISRLETVLVGNPVDPQEFLARVRALRERMPRMYLTEEFLRAAKNQGRP
jgi:antitoxin FitA